LAFKGGDAFKGDRLKRFHFKDHRFKNHFGRFNKFHNRFFHRHFFHDHLFFSFLLFPSFYYPSTFDYPYPYPYPDPAAAYPEEPLNYGLLSLEILPPEAELFVDGQYVGVAGDLTGKPVPAPVGDHVLEVRIGSYSSFHTLYVGPGSTTYFSKDAATGERSAPSPGQSSAPYPIEPSVASSEASAACPSDLQGGVLTMAVEPQDAQVFLDGKPVGSAQGLARAGIVLPEGEHELKVEAPGYEPHSQAVQVGCNDLVRVDVEMAREG
jgi:hypothetical protein